jgi:hypothetical protein
MFEGCFDAIGDIKVNYVLDLLGDYVWIIVCDDRI